MAIATRTTVAPHAGACFRSQHCAPGLAAMRRGALRSKHIVRAESDGRGFCSGDDRFKMSDYVEARVDSVQHIENQGPAIFLRFGSSHEFFLPVFVGQFEHDSLAKKLNDQTPARPPTHDLFKNSLEAMGYKVTKVRVTALIGNTYHARMHLATEDGSSEVDLDARPSDAINMAVRFRAPLYINREVAEKMGVRLLGSNRVDSIRTESHADIVRSCRDELVHHADPTVMLRLQLQIAVSEENFEQAARIRNEIEKIVSTDRTQSLAVAIETALADHRYEEAARLRTELHRLRQNPTK